MGQLKPKLRELLACHRQRHEQSSDSVDEEVSLDKILNLFHEFLQKVHCDENLEFLLKTDSFVTSDKEASNGYQEWSHVYDNYIKQDAPKECNLPETIRTVFDDCHTRLEVPLPQDIETARSHILHLLEDAYTKFQRHYAEPENQQSGSGGAKAEPYSSQSSSRESSASVLLSARPLHRSSSDYGCHTLKASDSQVIDTSDEIDEPQDLPAIRRLSSSRQSLQPLQQIQPPGSNPSVPHRIAILASPTSSRNSTVSEIFSTSPTALHRNKSTKKQLLSKFKFTRRYSGGSTSSGSASPS
ncbi:HCL456Wp [Eremothecium sinecaudum]|uniref:HCL456Wp n=1 Tax=Eremothecium sinecaudum TaxID=45286 RepID=A0A120K1S3_9SACH|nr:HCL456Wp [Eremothecium sinecaudum]AMD19695.1 HCL456Wp [Eremothecium sinecaudum]